MHGCGGKALILRSHSQSAPARAQVRHWRQGRHEHLRLPDTADTVVGQPVDQLLGRSRVRSDRPAAPAAAVGQVQQAQEECREEEEEVGEEVLCLELCEKDGIAGPAHTQRLCA